MCSCSAIAATSADEQLVPWAFMHDLIDHQRHHTAEAIVAKAKRSAGILMYRRGRPEPQVLLVHPGGPFWKNKDDGAWSIPKGLYEGDEDPLAAARREFA